MIYHFKNICIPYMEFYMLQKFDLLKMYGKTYGYLLQCIVILVHLCYISKV